MLLKNILVVLALFVSVSAQAIINGRNPDKVKSASTVSIRVDGYGRTCSGVIISAHLVLTAGHCLDGVSKDSSKVDITNVVNAEGRWKTLHLASNYGRHPLYIEPTASGKKEAIDIQYDFSYLKISEDLLVTFGLTPQQLPRLFTQTADIDQMLIGSNSAMVYGYGMTERPKHGDLSPSKSDLKKELSMSVTHDSTINILMARSAEKNRGLCEGDSGGGLFLTAKDGQVYLAGIVSGIYAGAGCGSKESYGAYSIVSQHICWVLKDSTTPTPPELSSLQCN